MQYEMKQFLWTPGDGVDLAALDRLRSHFTRPSKPMGEAWFMGTERLMYPALLGNLDDVTIDDLQKLLAEIASGTSSFGPMEEWSTWFHYLLGRTLPRSHEAHISYLLESLITAFMALYPNGVYREPYKGFYVDAISTLGRAIMDAECWNGSDIVMGTILRRSNNNPARVSMWWDASGDFTASMFFCLKYLSESDVGPWLYSAFDIPSPQWRAQMMVWFVGAKDIFTGVARWPSEFDIEAYPNVGWEWSHCLKAELATTDDSGSPPAAAFIAEGSRVAALAALTSYFTEERLLEWLDCMSTVPYLEAEFGDIPTRFESMCLAAGPK